MSSSVDIVSTVFAVVSNAMEIDEDEDEDDGSAIELDLEVHGACMPENVFRSETQWRHCKLGTSVCFMH